MSEPKPIYITPGYVEVRGDGNKLLFRFDPSRDLIEIKPPGGRKEVVDLRPYRAQCELVFISLGDDDVDT